MGSQLRVFKAPKAFFFCPQPPPAALSKKSSLKPLPDSRAVITIKRYLYPEPSYLGGRGRKPLQNERNMFCSLRETRASWGAVINVGRENNSIVLLPGSLVIDVQCSGHSMCGLSSSLVGRGVSARWNYLAQVQWSPVSPRTKLMFQMFLASHIDQGQKNFFYDDKILLLADERLSV